MKDLITPDIKVSKLLKKYPETLSVLLETSDHFKKLNNPLLRRTLAPRVTIEQAARIAGVELQKLLLRLNQAIGCEADFLKWCAQQGPLQSTKETAGEEQTRPSWLASAQVKTLDVRPIISSGKDPFEDIMREVDSLAENEVLLIVNSFEPVPLYRVMQGRGFAHFTEQEAGTYRVYFFQERKPEQELPPKEAKKKPESTASTKSVKELDVRELEPPEPMVRILEALSKLPENTILLVRHHREPLLLYEKLKQRSFQWEIQKLDENDYRLKIWKI
jgi:uncharacterized protein (DUF2249 family)